MFKQQLARERSGAQPLGHWLPGRETGCEAACLMHVLEPRDRSTSGTGKGGDWLWVSWESAGSGHGAGRGQLIFI